MTNIITHIQQLESLYGRPGQPALIKEARALTPHYRAIIEASPFVIVATAGTDGLDCSPRGDTRGFVRVVDDKTLLLPDRPGNNRLDSLRNVIRDTRIGLLFIVPGADVTLRVKGRGQIIVDADLQQSFAIDGKAARSVLRIAIESVFFQCARAILRSQIWNPEHRTLAQMLPTPGDMLQALNDAIDGGDYDRAWAKRAPSTLW